MLAFSPRIIGNSSPKSTGIEPARVRYVSDRPMPTCLPASYIACLILPPPFGALVPSHDNQGPGSSAGVGPGALAMYLPMGKEYDKGSSNILIEEFQQTILARRELAR